MAQEATCVAAGDVVTVRYRSTLDIKDLIPKINQQLQVRNESTNIQVKVLAMEELSDLAFHMSAEQDSTQIAYHYLLPMRWLPDGENATTWWLKENKPELLKQQESGRKNEDKPIKWKRTRFGAKIRNENPHATDPPPSLRLWKDVLKSAASRDSRETKEDLSPEVPTGGRTRFRGLEGKEKRCWHNFADPALRGNASPSNNPVWRRLDRARTIEIFAHRQDAFMVVELRGDGFVTQQVRRIIGSAVAIAHGWLPADFMDIATRPDVFIETPMAPVGNMYMAGARFDFNEVKRNNVLFGNSNGTQQAWMEELRDRLLTRASEQGAETNGTMWLENLRDVVAPRIRAQLQKLASEEALREARRNDGVLEDRVVLTNDEAVDLQHHNHRSEEGIPPIYEATLSLLREIVQQDKWPATSIARSRVIRAGDSSTEKQSGSFTVVNTALLDIADGGGISLPLANQLFPDLASAVFALERDLSSVPGSSASARPPSTHCAVNRNAEFTPHVDSGRGAGQSVSMIVGLGNYKGGGLMVEGVAHDIRYTILEFDGWKLRHWTEPFEGERFSLVWFTPEQSGNRKD
jgi:tRNA U38,U39,U40 pseudouridine synthase TruA